MIFDNSMYVMLLETRAIIKHRLISPLYVGFREENKDLLPNLDDFMKGSEQAFIFVNTNLVKHGCKFVPKSNDPSNDKTNHKAFNRGFDNAAASSSSTSRVDLPKSNLCKNSTGANEANLQFALNAQVDKKIEEEHVTKTTSSEKSFVSTPTTASGSPTNGPAKTMSSETTASNSSESSSSGSRSVDKEPKNTDSSMEERPDADTSTADAATANCIGDNSDTKLDELDSESFSLESCFTREMWSEMQEMEAHLAAERRKYGDDYQIVFKNVNPYLNEVIYNAEEEKFYVEVEYFSRYRFKFEPSEVAEEQIRFNSVTFEMDVAKGRGYGGGEFKIARSS